MFALFIFTHFFSFIHQQCEPMMTIKSLSYLTITLLLTSCSNTYTTKTNVDKENFSDYFASSNVKMYKSEKDFNTTFQYIGLVEGEDCQAKEHHAEPDEVNARTNARKAANKLKANAVVFTGCTLISKEQASQNPTPKQCVATTVCYGKAYYLNH